MQPPTLPSPELIFPPCGGRARWQVRLRTRSAAWRREMLSQMLIPLRAFEPDLIVVSAGFDGHAHDALEAGGLHDRDFEWMTAELVRRLPPVPFGLALCYSYFGAE